jgi:hypothetical protein
MHGRQIASIVEGHGEVHALPELIRRIAWERFGAYVQVPRPHRVPRANMIKGPDLDRAVRLQGGRVRGAGGVIILTDSDDANAPELQRHLQAIADSADEGQVIAVLAVREYEAWFLAGIQSLRRHQSVRDDAEFDGDPERPRDCKKALEQQMNESYDPIRHQVAFNAIMDINAAAARSPSMQCLVDAIGAIVLASPPEP